MFQGQSSQYHRIHIPVQDSLQEWTRNTLRGFEISIKWNQTKMWGFEIKQSYWMISLQQSISGWLPDSCWNFQHLQQQRGWTAKQWGIQRLLEKLDQEDLEATKRPHCGRRPKRLHLRESFHQQLPRGSQRGGRRGSDQPHAGQDTLHHDLLQVMSRTTPWSWSSSFSSSSSNQPRLASHEPCLLRRQCSPSENCSWKQSSGIWEKGKSVILLCILFHIVESTRIEPFSPRIM